MHVSERGGRVSAVRGADGVPEGGAGDALVDVGDALRHLGLRVAVVPLHPGVQVSIALLYRYKLVFACRMFLALFGCFRLGHDGGTRRVLAEASSERQAATECWL